MANGKLESTISGQHCELDSAAEGSAIPRGNTPDSYLELLIESLCRPSDWDTSSLSSSVSPSSKGRMELLLPTTMEEMEFNRRVEEQEKAARYHIPKLKVHLN